MTSKVSILTDSSANFPKEWAQQYNIHVIPLKIHWENETFLDGIDISPDEFYTRLADCKALPTTSQPSIQDFLQAFEKLADESEGIVVLLLSSGISSAVSTAQMAAQQFSRIPVDIIDTRLTASGQALVVLAAARAATQGKSISEIRQAVENIIHNLHIYFVVDTLEYLYRGGRIGNASRFLGTALNIKPILFLNSEGKIDALERVRTRGKALHRLIELIEAQTQKKPIHFWILHANEPEVAESFKEQINQQFPCVEGFISELSPVIGAHVGPGTIGVGFYTDEVELK